MKRKINRGYSWKYVEKGELCRPMAGYSPLLIRPCLEFWWRHRNQQTHWSPMPNKNPDNVIDWYPMIPSEMGVKHLTPYENLWYCNQDSLLYEKPVTFWIDTMIIAFNERQNGGINIPFYTHKPEQSLGNQRSHLSHWLAGLQQSHGSHCWSGCV